MPSTSDNFERIAVSQAELNPFLIAHERFVTYQGGKRAQLGRHRLDGLNLANRNLVEADFTAASLVGATLYGSNLERANFYCADLRGCNLQATKLVRADLRGAGFKGASLSYAILDGADLRAARMMIVGANGAALIDPNNQDAPMHVPDGVDFSNCSLKNASFGNAKLDNADFGGAILEGVKFNGAKLKNVSFRGAVLTGVDLTSFNLPPETLEGCVLDVTPEAHARIPQLKEMLASHEAWISTGIKDGKPASLDAEDLRPLGDFPAGRRLAGLSARKAIAIGVSLSDCALPAAKFAQADLRAVDFSGADLRGASFRGANLSHAVFARARIGALKLAGGGEICSDFADAVVDQNQLLDAVLDRTLPEMGIH